MKEYPKIHSIYKRDETTHKFIRGDYSLPEFGYLAYNDWVFTEKIDGTNIRVSWDKDNSSVVFGGRTDNAQIPTFLFKKLQELFPVDKFKLLYPDTSICLYGEGFGAKIQKGGGKYIPNDCSFILFDVMIGDYWLERNNVENIAENLSIATVPFIGAGTLKHALNMIENGVNSTFGDFLAEGMVLRPKIDLYSRKGHRIISKIKHVDL